MHDDGISVMEMVQGTNYVKRPAANSTEEKLLKHSFQIVKGGPSEVVLYLCSPYSSLVRKGSTNP
jgi:hypothetical protein